MSTKTLFRWHLWLGLLSGVFLFLIGLTGAIAVFAEEIDWLVLPPLRVSPAPDGRRAEPDDLLASLRAAYPDGRVTSINLSRRPSFAHTASVQVRGPDGRRRTLTVFLDPSTAVITGERQFGGGYTGSVYQFIRQSHVRLLMGFWGRVFVGLFGVTLVLSCITGIWFYRGWIKRLFQLRLKGGWGQRPPWAELHKFVGVWSLLFNLVIGLTGAVLGIENLYGKVRSTWLKPPPKAAGGVAPSPATPAADPGPVDRTSPAPLGLGALLQRAHAAFPDLTVRTVTFPSRPDGAVVLRGGVPNPFVADSHVRSASSVALNGATGEVVRVVDGRQLGFWRRVYWTFDPLHFGYFGGLITKIIWFVLGLTPSLLAISGAWMWWRRRAVSARSASEVTPAAAASIIQRRLPLLAAGLALAGAYVVVAGDLKGWRPTHQFFEHWLVKPVSLALAAFPVTILLGWLIWRMQSRPGWPAMVPWVLAAGWFVFLSGLFPP